MNRSKLIQNDGVQLAAFLVGKIVPRATLLILHRIVLTFKTFNVLPQNDKKLIGTLMIQIVWLCPPWNFPHFTSEMCYILSPSRAKRPLKSAGSEIWSFRKWLLKAIFSDCCNLTMENVNCRGSVLMSILACSDSSTRMYKWLGTRPVQTVLYCLAVTELHYVLEDELQVTLMIVQIIVHVQVSLSVSSWKKAATERLQSCMVSQW